MLINSNITDFEITRRKILKDKSLCFMDVVEFIESMGNELKGAKLYYSTDRINICTTIDEVREITLRNSAGIMYLITCNFGDVSYVLDESVAILKDRDDINGWRYRVVDGSGYGAIFIAKKKALANHANTLDIENI